MCFDFCQVLTVEIQKEKPLLTSLLLLHFITNDINFDTISTDIIRNYNEIKLYH